MEWIIKLNQVKWDEVKWIWNKNQWIMKNGFNLKN